MDIEQTESRLRRPSTLTFAALSVLTAAALAGCANPGPPRPPSLQLPEMVGDLSAERIGNRVLLQLDDALPNHRRSRHQGCSDRRAMPQQLASAASRANAAGPKKTACAPCNAVQRIPTASQETRQRGTTCLNRLLADPVGLADLPNPDPQRGGPVRRSISAAGGLCRFRSCSCAGRKSDRGRPAKPAASFEWKAS